MTARAIVLLLLAGATLFAAANVGVGWLYALGFLFLSYVLLAFGLAILTLRGLRVTLRPSERTVAGEGLACTVALEPSGTSARRFVSLLAPPLGTHRGVGPFRGYLVPEGWGHELVLEAPGGERTLVSLAIPAPRRGVYYLPPLVVQAPAQGLGAVHRAVRTAAEVIVRPRVVELPRLRWLQGRMAADLADRSAAPSAGYELIRTVREYRSGDALKSVHWRSTAKTGLLRIKETEGEASAGGVAIALDTGAGHTEATFEHAIEVAAALCAYAHGQGMAVTLYAQDGEPADQSLDGQLDWLAGIRRTPPPPPSAKGGKVMAGGRAMLLRWLRISRGGSDPQQGTAAGVVPATPYNGFPPFAEGGTVMAGGRAMLLRWLRISRGGSDPQQGTATGAVPATPYNGFPPFAEGGARGGPPYAVLISPATTMTGDFAHRIFVGAGPAPLGMIACPAGEDIAASLGGPHGA